MHGIRDKILSARKYFTYRAYLCGNMFDTVNDTVIRVTEDNITMLSHNLDNQLLFA